MPSGPGIGPMFSIISGNQQQEAANEQASDLGQESTYAYENSLVQAAANDYQTRKAQGTQNAQFGASGVTLAGSPLGILTETQQLGNQVSTAIKKQGALQSTLYSDQALQVLRQGSAAAFAGQAGALDQQYQYKLQKAQTVNSAIAGAASFGIGALTAPLSAGGGFGSSLAGRAANAIGNF